MSLSNCTRCGKVYSPVMGGREICQTCIQNEEDEYKKVFQYMSVRPSATAQEISAETGVELKDILRFVRENRLQLVRVDPSLRCETCGAPLSAGKICDNCRKKLNDDIKKDIDKTIKDSSKTREKYSISRNKEDGNIIRRKKP